ncbi:hypothetical protein BC833DRAFT_582679 [Globomyces pollinis-pini]|nr:hypothetical protein BC833DRAFT_582679 [Globomyces pollinis-pini]
MFGELGFGDTCECVDIAGNGKDTLYQFLLPEEVSHIHFKSSKEDYLFTDMAFIHSDGGVGSSKRTIKRYNYTSYFLHSFQLTTAGGSVDPDVELRFKNNNEEVVIKVQKEQSKELTEYYKALLCLSKAQSKNAKLLELTKIALDAHKFQMASQNNTPHSAMTFAEMCYEKYYPTSYGAVFSKALPK